MADNQDHQDNNLLTENKERVKELACINQTSAIIKEGKSVEETLQRICIILPKAWQYPEFTVARISFDGDTYISPNFTETKWVQKSEFETLDKKSGKIEIFYTKEYPVYDDGPFLNEERDLITNINGMVTGYLNSEAAKHIFEKKTSRLGQKRQSKQSLSTSSILNSRKLLQRFLNKFNYNRDIYHDLMPFKVREILVVATLYDAYSIEKEGRFTEHILGEYYQLSLSSMPRVTGVTSAEEAVENLRERHYDLVILMMGGNRTSLLQISNDIKEAFPYIPVYLLLNNNRDIEFLHDRYRTSLNIDRIFVWNGDSKVFFAMVKHLEDKVNIESDTKVGLVKVILLVEDSEKYYSRYLPMLYNSVMEQTKRIIEDVSTDELYKILRLRARPKILLATTYEEAVQILNNYKENMLCLISDVKFWKDGQKDENAGYSLVNYARTVIPGLPTIMQSSEKKNARMSYELGVSFIDKNSDTLLQDIRSFIMHYLGFGNFVYKDAHGRKIAVARTLKEFEKRLDTIPFESILYHGKRNHFSLWLMARGELKIAKMLHPVKIDDFKTAQEFRDYIKFMIRKYRHEQNKGKVVNFEESAILDESNIVNLGTGAMGGKGRGLAFINTLVYNLNFNEIIPEVNVRTPRTSFIGTDEFDMFLQLNNLNETIHYEKDYTNLRERFLKANLTAGLEKKLKVLLELIQKPIAVRSSSLFEDSLMQPFAGIFETYVLPNNHPDIKVRLRQLEGAIKMVYASIFSPNSQNYFEAINYKIEEEKMGVVVQELVGNQHNDYYYPHISGTAQSYNYYPIAHMKPEDGFAVAAVGLGRYVVEGEKAYRFCPKYPEIEINSPKALYKNSQVHFYAVDMRINDIDLIADGEDAGLAKLDIMDAEKHGTLKHSASVYDIDNNRIEPGISSYGPRIINFANILKYNYIPLAKTIDVILDVVKEAVGTPVEIEFAVDLNKDTNNLPSFYILQIKPMIGNEDDYNIEPEKIDKNNAILFCEKSMGNGMVDTLTDVIYVNKKKFNNLETREMAAEIDKLNRKMMDENRRYILIGPGRWGTSDRFIGVPVSWAQISNAKIIVEISTEDFPLDASLGSHFFHNVTSMGVGYFSVQNSSLTEFISWNKLDEQEVIETTTYFKHIRFKKPLSVIMDGKKRISMILTDYNNKKDDEWIY